ncbi:MAG TPA: diguanylate cyclase, partial [Phycisphaerae bacterium]|nr:diguanylate cyclase [Phycisphaerae bacterium]
AEMNAQLARQSRIDGLTGLLNRRAWDEAAAIEEERSLRHGREYAVLLIDVDHFKQYNDSLGHPEGDRCLQQVSRAISRACRNTDIVGRYGGEEFVVLAPETQPEAAGRLAERIREGIWQLAEAHPTSPAKRVTISIGVATSREGTLVDALRRADEFLYRAKSAGRNIVMGRLAVEPARRAAEPTGATVAAAASAVSPCVATVLVGHADEERREFFRACLERDGHRVTCTAGGEQALAAAAARPDVIVLQAGGPGPDGMECARRLKASVDTHDVPVVLAGEDEYAIAAFDSGADDFLAEPVREVELTSRVRCMIRRGAEKRDLLRSYRLRAEQVRFLTGLVDLCQAIGGATTAEEVCEHTAHAVEEITCCRRVALLLTDAARRSAEVACAHGIDLPSAPTLLEAAHGVLGQVLATDTAVVVERGDAEAAGRAEPGAAWASFLDEAPLLAAPLTGALGPVGVLVASGRTGGANFEPQAVEYVELIARVSGSALHTIRNRQERDSARDQVVAALARLAERRDDDTGRHIERVTRFACTLAEALRQRRVFAELSDEFMTDLARSVPLHDIGKVAIPDAVLLKPGRLSLAEMSVMRSHVEIGAETLRPLVTASPGVGFLSMALDIIRAHHEWWDGSGYPQGLMGEQIPLAARIVAVADVYDALTTDRVYRQAMPFEEARRLIRDASGSQFDPRVVAAFEGCADVFRAMS